MELRPYQIEILNETRKAYAEGSKAPCIVAPCGAGKSVIVAEIAKCATEKGNRVLFLVHRQELCEQIERTFQWWGVNMRLCYVGMVQTVARRMKRIHRPKLIITDENHHSLAATYKKIYAYFFDAKRVGVTATPIRLNGDGLGDVNDKLIMGVSTKWLIENKYLAPFDYYAPHITDLTGLRSSRGEYIASDITKRLDKPSIYGDVIKYYSELSNQKQAICYCASIEHSKKMAEQFCDAGIIAVHIDGETPTGSRATIIDDFRAGKIKILCNVDLISEGFDVPDCNTAILLRPTKSLTLYIQQSMRCMRYKENKRAVIIDHVGNYARFGLPDADRKWSLNVKPKLEEKEKTEEKIRVRQCPECYFTHEYSPQCPKCGYVYEVEGRKIQVNASSKLGRITDFILDFTTPDDCKTMNELSEYARKKGYKPGWVYYQARERGLI